jgi:hypothetical protein
MGSLQLDISEPSVFAISLVDYLWCTPLYGLMLTQYLNCFLFCLYGKVFWIGQILIIFSEESLVCARHYQGLGIWYCLKQDTCPHKAYILGRWIPINNIIKVHYILEGRGAGSQVSTIVWWDVCRFSGDNEYPKEREENALFWQLRTWCLSWILKDKWFWQRLFWGGVELVFLEVEDIWLSQDWQHLPAGYTGEILNKLHHIIW